MPKIQLGADGYRIVGDGGEEGMIVDYGEAATLDTDSLHYMALVDLGDDEEPKTCLGSGDWLRNVVSGGAVDVEQEEVTFDGLDDDEEEDDDEDLDDADGDEDDGDDDEDEVEELKQ